MLCSLLYHQGYYTPFVEVNRARNTYHTVWWRSDISPCSAVCQTLSRETQERVPGRWCSVVPSRHHCNLPATSLAGLTRALQQQTTQNKTAMNIVFFLVAQSGSNVIIMKVTASKISNQSPRCKTQTTNTLQYLIVWVTYNALVYPLF